MMRDLNIRQPQQPQVDWRDLVNDITRDFSPSMQQQLEWQRQDDAVKRNAITSTGCHQYSRACLNELLGLGQ
jgi:hypothetical protein